MKSDLHDNTALAHSVNAGLQCQCVSNTFHCDIATDATFCCSANHFTNVLFFWIDSYEVRYNSLGNFQSS